MNTGTVSAVQARRELYEVMATDLSFDAKAKRALDLGEEYLNTDNAHLTKIDQQAEYWKAISSTDPPDGEFPAGLRVDLSTTYCRRTVERGDSIALHDVPNQGLEADPAFETHEIHCYHGTPIRVNEEIYGTVCFIAEAPRDHPFTDDETLFAELIARMLENELQHSRLMNRVNRLEQFASVVSHDLRNPLNIAQGRLSIARNETDNEHIEIAEDAIDRMEDLITDVLAMTRQGQDVDETERVHLSSIAEVCWQSVETGNAELLIEVDLLFQADSDRVRQLFENLFRNAVEHGGEDVVVRVGTLPGKDGFYIEDNGSGIPDSRHEDVFEAGFSTGDDGIGLGLSIVEAVVSAHDWTIQVTEATTGGARFEISNIVTIRDS
ncbi:GAF domain-containing sensor histidine kinase [Haloquadratum walsbyi]|jgi:Signal transduction histidine kinase|uniref:histidine kinase n=1 Tax=Haloquadratum walsbyi J07HQW2 TaxID=1238425 RepID=U1NK77_9EURY|nr:GAF domain-containing sensor histidine kinase [Haloquadratum walsbyi]ERG97353.1 MAG: signal transduction histidine kinase [Haloquadratum walsbyi J07HQW2]